MLNMKKMVGGEIKKIKNLKFICTHGPKQPDKWTETKGQREKKICKNPYFKKNFFFENSFY